MFERVDFHEPAADFHARVIPEVPTAQIWVNHVTGPALVLGSAQRDESIVDRDACRSAGVDIVRRRSGGGAVLLIPGEVVWFDVLLPAAAVPGLGDDIHAPMLWLGERLAAVLRPHVDGEVTVHGRGMVTTPWSSLICFDGIGPGEVLLDGRKLVGISQRRTRAASRLQCCWYTNYNPARLVGLLSPAHRPLPSELQPVATLAADGDLLAELALTR
ncbi:MAG: lipoate-protein ligase A [Ilumatobacter sp.]|jgi:lipoate-protein ligase A